MSRTLGGCPAVLCVSGKWRTCLWKWQNLLKQWQHSHPHAVSSTYTYLLGWKSLCMIHISTVSVSCGSVAKWSVPNSTLFSPRAHPELVGVSCWRKIAIPSVVLAENLLRKFSSGITRILVCSDILCNFAKGAHQRKPQQYNVKPWRTFTGRWYFEALAFWERGSDLYFGVPKLWGHVYWYTVFDALRASYWCFPSEIPLLLLISYAVLPPVRCGFMVFQHHVANHS